jgi:hypothetical protein
MPKLPVAQTDGEADTSERKDRQLANAICLHVMSVLGRPNDFLRITARQVTQAGYRVNVHTGPDASASRIRHSFFVTTDGGGHIVTSEPAIVKHY